MAVPAIATTHANKHPQNKPLFISPSPFKKNGHKKSHEGSAPSDALSLRGSVSWPKLI
jgi:hypothetical protein